MKRNEVNGSPRNSASEAGPVLDSGLFSMRSLLHRFNLDTTIQLLYNDCVTVGTYVESHSFE